MPTATKRVNLKVQHDFLSLAVAYDPQGRKGLTLTVGRSGEKATCSDLRVSPETFKAAMNRFVAFLKIKDGGNYEDKMKRLETIANAADSYEGFVNSIPAA